MFASHPDGIRPAEAGEAKALADLWLESRKAAIPAIPPPVHTDAEVRSWIRDVVLPNDEVWAIGPAQAPRALMVLTPGWLEQLYVAPRSQGAGHGTRLVRFAQTRQSDLRLWTFESNRRARAFYEKLGFTVDGPASSENEEGAPALLYAWRR